MSHNIRNGIKRILWTFMEVFNFSAETRLAIYRRSGGYCEAPGCKNKATSIHHLLHNTIQNRKNYGNDKIQSEENGKHVCEQCHINYPLWDRPYVDALRNKWPEKNSKLYKTTN